MLVSPDAGKIIDNAVLYRNSAGPDGLLVIDTQSRESEVHAYPGGRRGRLIAGRDGYFAVCSTGPEDAAFHLAIAHFDAPSELIAGLDWDGRETRLKGDRSAFWLVRHVYLSPVFDRAAARTTRHAVALDPDLTVRTIVFDWFSHDRYDLGYQGLIDIAPDPMTNDWLVSIQRAGHIVACDPTGGDISEVIELAGRGGNATLEFLDAETLIAMDYDTLVKVDLPSRRTASSLLVQEGGLDPHSGMPMRLFAGDPHIDRLNGRIWVGRPYSNDLVAYDLESLSVVEHHAVNSEPIHCAFANDALFIREWRTGRLLIHPL